MHRRSFVKAIAAALPASGLHDILAAQTDLRKVAPAVPPVLHIVPAGQDRFGQAHTMGFSSLLFKVSTGETGGGLFLIEHTHLLPGGPALHLHLYQEEWFYVMEGKVAFQVGEQRLELNPGESVLAPRRVPHTFSSVSAGPSRMMIAFCPAGKMEKYFRDAADPKTPQGEAEYLRHYDMELIGPSPFWKT